MIIPICEVLIIVEKKITSLVARICPLAFFTFLSFLKKYLLKKVCSALQFYSPMPSNVVQQVKDNDRCPFVSNNSPEL